MQRITVVKGDASDSAAIKRAILDNNCDALVNTAGMASVAPWGSSDLPAIFKAVADAAVEAGRGKKAPLRAWFLGGLGIMDIPGTNTMFSNFVPIYLAHREDYHYVSSLPAGAIDWSILCPSVMTPESTDFSVPTKPLSRKLIGNADTPPLWQKPWAASIPLLGSVMAIGTNASRYNTTLEQNADFIARDIASGDRQYIGKRVGTIQEGA
ncbi:hypothetical protein ANO11243_095930 [Dothideomycetidae sp. 11243]|nr:hypothetical protein ANO11243_095930 [fungal sp. No.11243]